MSNIGSTSCKSTRDTVPYFGINGLSMILCLWSPLHGLIKVASNTRPCSNLGGTTLNGREEGGQYYFSQTCDQERFEARKVGFSWECLNIFATGCLYREGRNYGYSTLFIRIRLKIWEFPFKHFCYTNPKNRWDLHKRFPMLPSVPIFSPSFLVHDFVFLLLTPLLPPKNKWLSRPIAKVWKNKRHHSEWIVIMTCDLHMNAFCNDRFIMASDLIGVMISFSSFSLGFSLLRSRSG